MATLNRNEITKLSLQDHHIYGEKYGHPKSKSSEQANAMNKLKAEKVTFIKIKSMVTLNQNAINNHCV